MKKIHMSREQLVAEAIDLITEDVQTQAFDGEILPDLLSLIPTEKLIEFLPADEEDEEENQELIDAVIEEMKTQIADNDWTVIEGLLSFVPPENLKGFLPEEDEKMTLDISKIAALMHWAKMFRSGAVDDEHGEFIADILARVIIGTDSVDNKS